MIQSVINRTVQNGFDCLQVNTGQLELTIIPDLGGKISSLRDLRSNREWLWRHPRLAYRRIKHGSSYVEEADTGGWDECFPSVGPCKYPSPPWQGAFIQDHGELWSQAAVVEAEQQAENIVLKTSWQGQALPYNFTRTLTLSPNSARVRVEYAVRNTGEAPLNFVWCIHPLLAIEPGMQLRLPALARFNVDGASPADLLKTNSDLPYPFLMPGLDLPAIPQQDAARSVKIWSNPLPEGSGWAVLAAGNGELRMRWDVRLLPQVAIWMNFGAWAGDGGKPYFNLGLEPCIGGPDSLAKAVANQNPYAILPPHLEKTWWLEIELNS